MPSPSPATAADTERNLRAITRDGVFFSAMVGLGETYVPAFALAVGLGEVVAGLVATLPMLVGALFQLVTPWAVRRLHSYRRWVVLCAVLQALSFAPLFVGAAVGQIGVLWLGLAMAGYWAFGMATSPAWNAWVTTLVPEEARKRFFAHRARASQAALFVAILLGGSLLEWGQSRGSELSLFGFLFALALVARLVSARSLAQQSEAPGLAAGHRSLAPRQVLAAVREARSGRVLAYLLGMQAAVNVAAPYFTPYMLGSLAFSYAEFMALTAAAFLSRVAVLPLLGRIAQQRGTRAILWGGAVGITPLPILWLVSDEFVYLFAVQLVAGAAWAALEYATLLSFFEGIGEGERTSVLAAFNLGNALTIALGALVGTQVFVSLDGSLGGYAWIFGISSGARLAMLLVLRGTIPARRLLSMPLRVLAVRPSAGAIERPILAGLSGAAPESPVPRSREEVG